jgi:Domain of unknown function (DUF397)
MNNTGSAWRKSTYSLPQDNCVEVAATSQGRAAVRDTQDREGPQLAFAPRDWNRFLTRVRAVEA